MKLQRNYQVFQVYQDLLDLLEIQDVQERHVGLVDMVSTAVARISSPVYKKRLVLRPACLENRPDQDFRVILEDQYHLVVLVHQVYSMLKIDEPLING